MIVVVDGSLSDVVVAGRRLHHNAIIGTIAALTPDYFLTLSYYGCFGG